MAKLVVGTVVWVVIMAKLSKVVPKVPEGIFFFFKFWKFGLNIVNSAIVSHFELANKCRCLIEFWQEKALSCALYSIISRLFFFFLTYVQTKR
jgi:hypothetical protein